MTKKKPFSTCGDALKKLIDDVPAGEYRVYDVSSFPGGLEVFPEGYMDKCSEVCVATSGDSGGIGWMAICPARIDGKARAVDIDPAIALFDSASLEPSPSGMVGYHQDYVGRTRHITGAYNWHDFEGTVEALRGMINAGAAPLDEAPEHVLNSLHHMADLIRRDPEFPTPLTGDEPQGTEQEDG